MNSTKLEARLLLHGHIFEVVIVHCYLKSNSNRTLMTLRTLLLPSTETAIVITDLVSLSKKQMQYDTTVNGVLRGIMLCSKNAYVRPLISKFKNPQSKYEF